MTPDGLIPVTCDECRGGYTVDSRKCEKCDGQGLDWIKPEPKRPGIHPKTLRNAIVAGILIAYAIARLLWK